MDNPKGQQSNMIISHSREPYSAALEIARQLNAQSKNRRALKVFNALSRPEVLPFVAGVVGVAVAGIVSALRSANRHEERAANRAVPAQNRQLMVIRETAIQISPVQLVVVSRTRIVEPED